MSDQPTAAANAAPEPAADPASAAPETAAPAVPATPEAPPPPAPVDKGALIAGFLNRIEQGEFDQTEDAFHRFVVKETYPLLGSGTLNAKDLELIARKYSARADPYNRGSDTPETAPKLAATPAK
jgi:hypothetical protein